MEEENGEDFATWLIDNNLYTISWDEFINHWNTYHPNGDVEDDDDDDDDDDGREEG
jgi:hypothetical protein